MMNNMEKAEEKEQLEKTQLLSSEQQLQIQQEDYEKITTGEIRELPRHGTSGVRNQKTMDAEESFTNTERGIGKTAKKIIIIGGVFFAALVTGFVLSDSAQEQERMRQEQATAVQDLEIRQSHMAKEEAALEQQKAALEKQKSELEARERELEKEEARLQGKEERIEQEKASNSVVDNVIDKITGKDGERKREAADVETDINKLHEELKTLRAAIQDTDTTLQKIDEQLDSLGELAESARRASDTAREAYKENEQLINKVLTFIEQGANVLRAFFTSK
ncbi:hypothetical protein [Selenomonas sp. TAMA-11512]|uniref:hypothetical protein n=1 Tax=Selenomonas sp. TAMA-11512 TaxID=3095337 RepID=UPI0030CC0317